MAHEKQKKDIVLNQIERLVKNKMISNQVKKIKLLWSLDEND